MTKTLTLDTALSAEEKKARRKAQQKSAQDKYRAANREKLNEASRLYRRSNLEKNAARMRDYRARNPEIIAAIEARRIRPAGFREQFNLYRRGWAKLNPEKLREYAHKRSGLKLGRLPSGTIAKTGERQKWKCVGCSACLRASGYHKDHIVPLALGGEHSSTNIQLLCPACNLSKGAKHPIDFMVKRGYLL